MAAVVMGPMSEAMLTAPRNIWHMRLRAATLWGDTQIFHD